MKKRKKILVVAGTRPEVIKLAPVIHELARRSDRFNTRICLTGQHREMADEAIRLFDIKGDYKLNIMRKNQTLTHLTASLLNKLTGVIEDFNPHIIVAQGDTTSAFVGALAGFYQRVHVAHVEAGLRTYNKFSPFPEEINRSLIAVLSDHHFAPTTRAKRALLCEGIEESRISVTGNTVVDALLHILKRIKVLPPFLGELEAVVGNGSKMVLITGHRRESFGQGFENICMAIRSLAQKFDDCNFLYPVHLNPHVREPVFKILRGLPNVHLVAPVGYLPFVRLMSESYVILTDSGGIQEEAPSLGKPVLVMRETTERTEAIEAGTAILVGTDKNKIIKELSRLLTDEKRWNEMRNARNPYGDGRASKRICNGLENFTS
jgi:UDP-N-acetylglucosamine 2-epimerase (non-hydrolysing)